MRLPAILSSVPLLFSMGNAHADFFEQFVDPTDGRMDASQWLMDNAVGFLPVPIIITDPAVGYGGGLVLAFFHENEERQNNLVEDEDPNAPLKLTPSVSGLLGLATENGTRGAGAFHMGIWKQDTIRYIGAIAGVDANIDSFRLPSDGIIGDIPIRVNLKGTYLLQQIRFRLGDSPWFAGAKYSYLDSDSEFSIGDLPDYLKPQLSMKDGGLALLLNYDTRDNSFSPNQGLYGNVSYAKHADYFGGDKDYAIASGEFSGFSYLGGKFQGSARLSASSAHGDTPYYALPFIDMRGIPAMRYQGERMATLQGELRYDFGARWSGVVFGGLGQAFNADQHLGDTPNRYAKGIGFRYLMARRFNLRTGIDVARGPEDTTVHFIVGAGWSDF
ncbi:MULTISPECIES: glyceraldehyde-3-phosphate dehydrogenase [unclassified Agarivorans]|uniref:glyceraldehyde-3-phosphate dehydrogenase n=1 Tax=unclassified Agarivorans TaxID=2636026 RepID=UPI0026E1A047|nr:MULTISPECIES: glyceraldehyde-3-phosphate dehydrogenase [unclassified Agarivorans]MDO6684664.1 glyceraldehyde-3-phosphate dehydrogenase [Agarivorans sp. 3_MG-2023]MDO6714829.1 glyceraldehyde-3-phosphate dehydrogenase [Agarivorans sp. 2_MG-2023]